MKIVQLDIPGEGLPGPSSAKAYLPRAGADDVAAIIQGGGLISADALSERLGVGLDVIEGWRQANRILGLSVLETSFMFAVDQFTAAGEPIPGIDRIVAAAENSHWAVWRFLMAKIPEFDGVTGMDLLKNGQVEKILSVIEARNQGSFS